MKLVEAIVDANKRAVAGDKTAGLNPDEFRGFLPLVALTCIDPRLNRLFPNVLGILEDDFIWLRNAGNIITGPMSSTLRSLALACAIKGGREIAIIGHTDCKARQATVLSLTDGFKALGVDRAALPDNLNEFFGLFASERQNVLKAVAIARSSPLIGSRVPVHGLLVDTATGALEWIVNGYDTLPGTVGGPQASAARSQGPATLPNLGSSLEHVPQIKLSDWEFPAFKIGEMPAGQGAFPSAIPIEPKLVEPPPLTAQPPPIEKRPVRRLPRRLP